VVAVAEVRARVGPGDDVVREDLGQREVNRGGVVREEGVVVGREDRHVAGAREEPCQVVVDEGLDQGRQVALGGGDVDDSVRRRISGRRRRRRRPPATRRPPTRRPDEGAGVREAYGLEAGGPCAVDDDVGAVRRGDEGLAGAVRGDAPRVALGAARVAAQVRPEAAAVRVVEGRPVKFHQVPRRRRRDVVEPDIQSFPGDVGLTAGHFNATPLDDPSPRRVLESSGSHDDLPGLEHLAALQIRPVARHQPGQQQQQKRDHHQHRGGQRCATTCPFWRFFLPRKSLSHFPASASGQKEAHVGHRLTSLSHFPAKQCSAAAYPKSQ